MLAGWGFTNGPGAVSSQLPYVKQPMQINAFWVESFFEGWSLWANLPFSFLSQMGLLWETCWTPVAPSREREKQV